MKPKRKRKLQRSRRRNAQASFTLMRSTLDFGGECWESLDDFDDGAEVATYELKDIRKVVKKTELV